MKFVLSMRELGNLVAAHINEQYGRGVKDVTFVTTDLSDEVTAHVEDAGPVDDEPDPDRDPSLPAMASLTVAPDGTCVLPQDVMRYVRWREGKALYLCISDDNEVVIRNADEAFPAMTDEEVGNE